MKKNPYIKLSILLVGILLVLQMSKYKTQPRIQSANIDALAEIKAITASPQQFEKRSLAANGLLWEKIQTNGRECMNKSMPVAADCFAEAMLREIGSPVTVHFSEKIPLLLATVTGRNTTIDGTVVTHLSVAGSPKGQLTIQENASMDFFVAQLYFNNHPVGYEFKKSVAAIVATRHELSEMICSLIDHQTKEVSLMGLPPVDKLRGKKSSEEDEIAISKAKKLLQEAPTFGGGGSATPSLRIADASIAEGDSGSKNLSFTVTLSKADRNKTISVNYNTANGAAAAGTDYNASSGTLLIAAGKTSATLNVAITGDTNTEPDETFFVNLSNPVNAVISDAQSVGLITNDDSAPSSVPAFNSLPGAVAVAYLDMDGQVVSGTQWAGGSTINARGVVGVLTDAQMLEVCRRTAEDYSPFQINVTTEEKVYLSAPSNRRIRCVITPDNEWFGTAGGVAYLNSFTWTGDTPCWVFSDQLASSSRYIAEAASHEIGHTLSLSHDGRISPSEAYYQGHGSGEVGWAPIMGVGYYKLLVQWSRGEYLSASNTENDLNKITTLNGFGYRVDQVSNSIVSATPLSGSSGTRTASGILETTGDQDVFSFSTVGGSSTFSALGDATSQNVDVLMEILDATGAVVSSANPDTLTDTSVTATLIAGNYFLRVSGVGRGDILIDGYSNYASIGQYSISGSAP